MSIEELLKQFSFPVYLAPMESITDQSFRMICKSKGADILLSEFISSDALSREVSKSLQKMEFNEEERPFGIQIFGHDEQSLVSAAEIAATGHPDFIDINWGCPVKKVVSKGAGSGILRDIPKMIALTAAVVKAVNIPVTVKTRLGWDSNDMPIVSVAEKLQDIGIQAITIHGRTRAQMYSGEANWELIGKTKSNERLHIPVIGNGDLNTAEKAIAYKTLYGVDAVMIGRSAIGNPWIFQQIKEATAGRDIVQPTYKERVETILQHLRASVEEKGERRAVLEMRTQYAGYFRGVYNFKPLRIQLMSATTFRECEQILNLYEDAKIM